MKYIIYKTRNLINERYYIGYHVTDDINDDYLGSGKLLKKAIEKYGRKNFEKEILYIFPTREEAFIKELEMVSQEIVDDKKSYNLKIGGDGGWDYINEKLKNDSSYKDWFYKNHSFLIKKLHEQGKLKGWSYYNEFIKLNQLSNGFKDKHHTDKSKQKISENNGNKISQEVIKQRIKDYDNSDKKWGYISKLSKIWGISHTEVKRFLKNKLRYLPL